MMARLPLLLIQEGLFKMATHKGSCHCGKVSFEVTAPTDITVARCNCSMCSLTGFIHFIIDKENFNLISGEDDITTYTFNSHIAQHKFCKHCGIKSFYIPRSHPDGISVSLNALNQDTVTSIEYKEFDGANWEKNVAALRENLS